MHRDRPMKIQRAIEMTQLFLHAIWKNPDPSSPIERPGLNRDDAIKQHLIATVDRNASLHRTVTPLFTSLNVVLCDGRTCPWNFKKFKLFRHPLHVPFDSLCSYCIFASKDYLKSKFDRERRKKSHLELQNSSSKMRNEKPCIWQLIGSFQRLIWVRLRVFILIFHHLVLILHFE